MRPLSRGYVKAKSNRPGESPAINPCYLSEEADRRAVVGGLRFARRILAAPALKQFVREESLPGAQVHGDDELLDHARRNGSTCYHASCTCMMGSRPMSVVDSELRVHGLDGLRVIRRLGDAGGHLDQHERPDDHDRREGRGNYQRRRTATNGSVGKARGGGG
jgi:choline dehydrogenase